MRLLLDVTFVCHPVRLRICGKCREMRRSEAEGRFGEAEPEGCASIRVSFVPYAVLFSTVCCTDPTVLPIRKAPLALMSDPLDNQEIAFGVVHFALRLSPSRYSSRIPVSCCGASAPYSRALRGLEQSLLFWLYLAPIISWRSESELQNTERHCAERRNADRTMTAHKARSPA